MCLVSHRKEVSCGPRPMSAGSRAHALFTTSFGLLSESSGSLLACFPLWEHLAMSGDVLSCHNFRVGWDCYWYLVGQIHRSDTLVNNAQNSCKEICSSEWR